MSNVAGLHGFVTLDKWVGDAPYQLSLPTGVLKGLQKLSKVAHLPVRVVAEATRLNCVEMLWATIIGGVCVINYYQLLYGFQLVPHVTV